MQGWLRRWDLNPQPRGPKPRALPSCATSQYGAKGRNLHLHKINGGFTDR